MTRRDPSRGEVVVFGSGILGPVAAAAVVSIAALLLAPAAQAARPGRSATRSAPDSDRIAASRPGASSVPATASAPAVDANLVRRLIAQLDDDDWRTRDRATQELARLGDAVEEDLKAALARPGASLELRARAGPIFARLASRRLDIAGVWEEQPWGDVTSRDRLLIALGTDGNIRMTPSLDAPHPHFAYGKATRGGDRLTFYVLTNPGYEFDIAMKIVSPTKMTGTRTRRSDNQTWDFTLLKVRDLDGTPVAQPEKTKRE